MSSYTYYPLIPTPALLIFVVCWLLLRLTDVFEQLRPAAAPYPIFRLVIVLVGLVLVLI
jgi:hypothetical protein